jgi:valyl-tRNA synthetase
MFKRLIKEKTRYNPLEYENKIYNFWIPYFKYKKRSGKNFTILIAPPNITGSLHMGHALENIILDFLARYKSLLGYDVVWFPGIDHAGIATQNVVEKELKKQGTNRFELGREKFIEKIWQWKEKNENIILDQFKKLGLYLDWSRKRFTMDKKYVEWVEKAFIVYHKKGLVYRDLRPVNFCPKCKTSLSDLELEYKQTEGFLYYIKYPLKSNGFLTIATTRPETILGDVALAINPKDYKNFDLIGKTALLPILNRELPIIVDARVDPDFGTGILKITPAHSLVDYEISQRHHLPMISVINEEGFMNKEAREFEGLSYLQAREEILKRLKELDLIEKIEPLIHQVPICDRCKTEIQVIPSKEWFLKMDYLSNLAYKAISSKEVEIFPPRFKKPYFGWLKNIRDWCISRKIWWGQTMPVWYCKNCSDVYEISRKKPSKICKNCKKKIWIKTDEVFDTWFSSALWPFAILYSHKEKKFYPADIVASAREILQLWIARMIFSGKFFTKKYPFKKVFIHPTVLTKEGKRMSKSLGIGVDPLDLISKYGSDSLRFGILWQMSARQDLKFDESPVYQGQKFLNKIWNAYRFYFLNLNNFKKKNKSDKLSSFDKRILKSLRTTKKFVAKKAESFEFGLSLKKVYKFFWNELCDIYLESWKKSSKNNFKVFERVMFETLVLLHPFVPHITQLIYFSFGRKKPIFFEKWD